MSLLPMADAVSDEKDVKQAKRIIAEKQLVGAANNTKWNKLISEMRELPNPPCYRTKVVNGYISGWDSEWYYHLPFPLLCVEWIDIELTDNALSLVSSIGFEFEKTKSTIRIWGYFPKCYESFGEKYT
ncbi:MAG TPA: hypothetical protein ENH67_09225 [Pseudoalteromonas sp.]|uniref:Uncharacterized protein n=1 Tax=marine sediment metagenome TaxID=412755 RepID=A0A0F9QUM8_9ZZZZ|nr:DUF6678 family protein [Pseudoalteromonas sp.]HDY91839.1 hypothetical protein [Pseudoalteromonas sp.]HDZ33051.1 hypothetical protein [Pseudoalteromonas sp.]